MKHLLIIVSLLFAGQSMAQEKKKAERAQPAPAPSSAAVVSVHQDFLKADLDQDGGISIAELTNIKDDYEKFNVEEIFQLLDKDGDGILSPTEFGASAEALRKRPGKLSK